MTLRRCVICGERPPITDTQGKNTYTYPKNEEEARIWKISMAAKECSVESIQKECCVCLEHIPHFVSRAKAIGKELSAQDKKRKEERLAAASKAKTGTKEKCRAAEEKEKDKEGEAEEKDEVEEAEEKEKVSDECVQCPDTRKPSVDREKPSVSVLLLNGSSLPTYCAESKGSACVDFQPVKIGDSKCIPTKRIISKGSDTEIFVLESGFQDTGGKCPDIDGTELTLLRAPTQEEDELTVLREELMGEEEEDADPNARRRRACCLPGCTDVLLLGRGKHEMDECPCQCDDCKKASGLSEPEPGSEPECCPKDEPEYFTHPPCGFECEQVRSELGKVIQAQALRILELEDLLCRQNNMRNSLQKKLDELYREFGRLDDVESAANRSGISCPESNRSNPDRASVLSARPTPTPPPETVPTEPRPSLISKLSVRKMTSSTSKVVEESPPEKLPVHGFAEQTSEHKKRTRRPQWVNEAESEEQLVSSTPGQRPSIRFSDDPVSSDGNTAAYPPKMKSEMANPSSQSRSQHSSQPSGSRSIYSDVTRPYSLSNISRSIYSDVTRPNSKSNVSRSAYSDVSRSNLSQSIFLDMTKSNPSISRRYRA